MPVTQPHRPVASSALGETLREQSAVRRGSRFSIISGVVRDKCVERLS